MKKFLATLSIVLMSMTMVFAAAGAVSGSTTIPNAPGVDATTEVKLTINDSDVNAYAIGFTDGTKNQAAVGWEGKYTDMTSVPESAIAMNLAYNKNNNTIGHKGDETFFVFYKVRSAKPFTLTLSCGGPLTDTAGTSTTPIDYEITMGTGNGTVKSQNNTEPGSKWTLKVDPKSAATDGHSNYAANKVEMTFTTKTTVTAGMAGTYSSTLTLNVASDV